LVDFLASAATEKNNTAKKIVKLFFIIEFLTLIRP
jgi:hypothetical protein